MGQMGVVLKGIRSSAIIPPLWKALRDCVCGLSQNAQDAPGMCEDIGAGNAS